MSEIINDRKPTAIDREVLAYLQAGQSLTHIDVLNKFKSTQSRDIFWRLRKAGYPIKDEFVYYTATNGKPKKYKRYFITPPEIISAGAKTDKELLKGTKSIVETTRDMQKTCESAKMIQTSIFDQMPANRL